MCFTVKLSSLQHFRAPQHQYSEWVFSKLEVRGLEGPQTFSLSIFVSITVPICASEDIEKVVKDHAAHLRSTVMEELVKLA